LPQDKVVGYVDKALEKCPQLTVVGVAGPGDSLVGNNMLDAFKKLRASHPELLRCISTNGLLLNERAKELIDVGIDTLTVTVNAVDSEILSKIILGIYYKGEHLAGTEAAEVLIANQLEGIRKMAAANVMIKVNTVLVPEINGAHIPEIAEKVSLAGANIYNIIPLIPQHRMSSYAAPACEEIEAARMKAGKFIDVFRHCQHCRADAVGIPGVNDFAKELSPGQVKEVFSHG
jgi:nitrogen fixation protein NifB